MNSDDLRADGVAGAVKDLIDELGPGEQANALAVGLGFLVSHDLSKDCEFVRRKNLGLGFQKRAAFPDLAFVAQLIRPELKPLVRRRAGFAIEN